MHGPEPDSLSVSNYLAAAAGALLGLRAFPGSSPRQIVANLVVGALTAVFVGPGLADWEGTTSPRIYAFIIFATGATGLVFFSAVIEGVRQTPFGQILTGWLSKKGTTL